MNISTEKAMFEMMEKELYTAVICDILDDLGYRNQIMSTRIRPLERDFIAVGRARTILAADVYTQPDEPYKTEIEAVDAVKENEMVVVATNCSVSNAFWGELLSTASMARGARGAVIYGCTRDVRKILDLGFKVFTSDINPLDSKGRALVIDHNCDIDCGGVVVHPGEIVFADYDGIVVIPKAVENKVIDKALEKVHKEKKSLEELKKGAFLKDIFEKYKIL